MVITVYFRGEGSGRGGEGLGVGRVDIRTIAQLLFGYNPTCTLVIFISYIVLLLSIFIGQEYYIS